MGNLEFSSCLVEGSYSYALTVMFNTGGLLDLTHNVPLYIILHWKSWVFFCSLIKTRFVTNAALEIFSKANNIYTECIWKVASSKNWLRYDIQNLKITQACRSGTPLRTFSLFFVIWKTAIYQHSTGWQILCATIMFCLLVFLLICWIKILQIVLCIICWWFNASGNSKWSSIKTLRVL